MRKSEYRSLYSKFYGAHHGELNLYNIVRWLGKAQSEQRPFQDAIELVSQNVAINGNRTLDPTETCREMVTYTLHGRVPRLLPCRTRAVRCTFNWLIYSTKHQLAYAMRPKSTLTPIMRHSLLLMRTSFAVPLHGRKLQCLLS